MGGRRPGAVVAIGPAMIGTAEMGGVAAVVLAEPRAAMAAVVRQDVDLALGVAGDDDLVEADLAQHEVAGIGYLGLVSDEHPVAREDLFHLRFEDGGIA